MSNSFTPSASQLETPFAAVFSVLFICHLMITQCGHNMHSTV